MNTGVRVFSRLHHEEKNLRIIPSLGMMQAFLEAQYGDEAVELLPRTHLSTISHISDNRLTKTCDIMIPFPDNPHSAPPHPVEYIF